MSDKELSNDAPEKVWLHSYTMDGREFTDFVSEKPIGDNAAPYFKASLLQDPKFLAEHDISKTPKYCHACNNVGSTRKLFFSTPCQCVLDPQGVYQFLKNLKEMEVEELPVGCANCKSTLPCEETCGASPFIKANK